MGSGKHADIAKSVGQKTIDAPAVCSHQQGQMIGDFGSIGVTELLNDNKPDDEQRDSGHQHHGQHHGSAFGLLMSILKRVGLHEYVLSVIAVSKVDRWPDG
jgi:hypothetical protein